MHSGTHYTARSSSPPSLRPTGFEKFYGAPQGWTLLRKIDISSRRDGALGCGECRTDQVRAAGADFSVESDSRRFLGHVVQKRPLLFAGEELEEPQSRLQENIGIFILQIRSCQKVCADHLQAVAAGLVAAQHQSRRLDRLLHDRNLAFV